MLREILNQHPNVVIPDVESHFVPQLVEAYRTRRHIDARIVRRSNFYHDVVRQDAAFAQAVTQAGDAGDLASYLRQILRAAAGHAAASDAIIGDKTPAYVFHLQTLAEGIPGALFVHMVRDPRAVAASARRAWGKSVVRSAHAWHVGAESVAAFNESHPGRLVTIRYEDLLDAALEMLAPVWQLLRIESLTHLAEFRRPVENLGGARGATNLQPDRARAFLRELTRPEIGTVEALCAHSMPTYGYHPIADVEPAKAPKSQLMRLRILDTGRRVVALGKERGLVEGIQYALRSFRTYTRVG